MNLRCVPCYVRSLLFSMLLVGVSLLVRGTAWAGWVEGAIVAASLVWVLSRSSHPAPAVQCELPPR